MKNTFKINLGTINFTVDGVPVNIDGTTIEYECDANVHEMAQSLATVKTLYTEIKEIIKAEKATVCDTVAKPVIAENIVTTTPKTTDHKALELSDEEKLARKWQEILKRKPETFVRTGVGRYEYQEDPAPESEKSLSARLTFESDKIVLTVHAERTTVTINIRADYAHLCGINRCLIDDLVKGLECDDETKRFIDSMLKAE